jgi:hypothetical protein
VVSKKKKKEEEEKRKSKRKTMKKNLVANTSDRCAHRLGSVLALVIWIAVVSTAANPAVQALAPGCRHERWVRELSTTARPD